MKKSICVLSLFVSLFFLYAEEAIKRVNVTATSVLIEGNKDTNFYGVSNICDGTWMSWVEGESGNGVGTIITFDFFEPVDLFVISIKNGYGDLRYHFLNNRVKEILVTIDDVYEIEKTLADTYEFQNVYLYTKNDISKKVKKMTIMIKSVYPGSKYNDTCIAEIIFDRLVYKRIPLFDPFSKELFQSYSLQVNKHLQTRINDKGLVEVLRIPSEMDVSQGSLSPYWFTWMWPLPDNIFITRYSEPFAIVQRDFIDKHHGFGFSRGIDFYIYKSGKWQMDNQNPLFAPIKKYIDKANTENKPILFSMSYNSDNRKEDILKIIIKSEKNHYFQYRNVLQEIK